MYLAQKKPYNAIINNNTVISKQKREVSDMTAKGRILAIRLAERMESKKNKASAYKVNIKFKNIGLEKEISRQGGTCIYEKRK